MFAYAQRPDPLPVEESDDRLFTGVEALGRGMLLAA
jgi:hypothetical protein